jgi:pilus assembly protein CpaF
VNRSVAARVHERLVAEARTAVPTGDRITTLIHEEAPLLPPSAEAEVLAAVLADVHGLGPLEPLLSDPAVTDLMVNGTGDVWIERLGALECTGLVLAAPEVERLIERIVTPLGLRADRASPLVDARLPDGSRVHAVLPPLAVDGPCLTIRRFGTRTLPIGAFASTEIASLLTQAVKSRANIVIAGGTGTGKTTLLNALAAEIPQGERIITVEDAAELRLPQPHLMRLESRPASAEGSGQVTVRELVRNALRMRPDRLIVGECRGPEALDMLQAMNTGHEGSLTTCHANSPEDALRRLETMVLMAEIGLPLDAVREQLASAVDLVVHVVRASGGTRRVDAVAEVAPPDATGPGRGTRVRRLVVEGAVLGAPSRPRCTTSVPRTTVS